MPSGGWSRPPGTTETGHTPAAGMVVVDEEEFARLPGAIEMYRAALALVAR